MNGCLNVTKKKSSAAFLKFCISVYIFVIYETNNLNVLLPIDSFKRVGIVSMH